MQNSNEGRLLALEGLRGVAAVAVVIFHGLSMFYPIFLYGALSGLGLIQNSRFEDNLYGNPVSVIFSGAFAVAIFFVLSGFVLTVSFFNSGDEKSIMRIAGKRYLRLMIPALSSILVTLFILAIGLDWMKPLVADITGSLWLKNLWQPAEPSLMNALSQGVWGVFFSSVAETSYNPVLWTMKFELLGSLLVFAIALLFGKAKHRWIIYVLLIIATFKTWYLAFIIGMILADLYAHRKYPFFTESKRYGWLTLLLIIGIFLGGYPYYVPNGSVYAVLQLPWLYPLENNSLYLSIAAGLILVSVICLKPLSKFFGSKYISMLGKYSFSIYLVHMAVLFTAGAGVFLWLNPIIGFHWAAALSILTSLIILVPAAYLFERYVDSPAIRISSLFSRWLFDESKTTEKSTKILRKRK
ncbi:MAG: acyltransferase [Patescibacteria group bacterium]